jgi:hypothetical protein
MLGQFPDPKYCKYCKNAMSLASRFIRRQRRALLSSRKRDLFSLIALLLFPPTAPTTTAAGPCSSSSSRTRAGKRGVETPLSEMQNNVMKMVKTMEEGQRVV